jgi:hypothetical protein
MTYIHMILRNHHWAIIHYSVIMRIGCEVPERGHQDACLEPEPDTQPTTQDLALEPDMENTTMGVKYNLMEVAPKLRHKPSFGRSGIGSIYQ